jgi:hypothetical protein
MKDGKLLPTGLIVFTITVTLFATSCGWHFRCCSCRLCGCCCYDSGCRGFTSKIALKEWGDFFQLYNYEKFFHGLRLKTHEVFATSRLSNLSRAIYRTEKFSPIASIAVTQFQTVFLICVVFKVAWIIQRAAITIHRVQKHLSCLGTTSACNWIIRKFKNTICL